MAIRTVSPFSASTGRRWAVLGALIGAVLALSIYAPARWLAAWLASRSNGHLQLVNARGTVWNGRAGVVFSSGASGAESISLPGTLGWTLRPRWDGVVAALDIPCCAPQPLQFKASPRPSGLQLAWRDGQSRWPAALLSGFGAPWNTLKPEGVLDISMQAFAMQWNGPQLGLAGRATLDATDISSSLSTLKPMGSYRLTLEGGPAPTLLLTTREGSLQLSGSGRWNGNALRFDGEASAAPGREDALSNLLNIIGRREGARSLITLG
ncbi:type II secretion system protein N [Variovorax paradoxus]|nr:type II secretion system protein N [Variovorax paradoxus]